MDTNHSIPYSGQPGTFFGYSVAILKSNDPNKDPTILIGAPKDTYNGTKFVRTGVLYKCKLSPNSCSSSRVYSLGRSLPDLTGQNVSDAWIGENINVNPNDRKILTCGHRWKLFNKDDYGVTTLHMQGICYYGDVETDVYELIKRGKTKDHAGMGKDAAFSKTGLEIILGVPGANTLTGGVLIFETSNLKSGKLYSVASKNNSYVGYSVGSGMFFRDKLEYYVMGAPRYNNTGAVYIVNKNTFVRQEISDTNQLGAYFGASICVTDINSDGFDDMLVGTPLYSKHVLEGGAVMLYLSDGQNLKYHKTILGMEKERSQFGTTIKDVGDINNDGYNDIIIGAPYENNQEGAIYIYNLGPHGFPANFSQRISGQDFGKKMKGFGISISKAVDINADSYPDFLVGSYLSNEVRLLKSRPVIDLKFTATTEPERIDVTKYNCPPPNTKSICLKLKLTVSYHTPYSYLPSTLQLDCKLSSEVSSLANNASSSVHRALIISGSDYKESKQFNLSISSTPTPVDFDLLIKDKTDTLTPIAIFLDYKIQDGSLMKCTNLCPVLKGNQYKKLIYYNLDCGADEKCTSDLHLSMTSDRDHILSGKKQTFSLFVSVFNAGESAYNSLALFTFPSYVQYVQVKHTGVSECSSDTSSNEELVRCSLGNQIPQNTNVTFTLVFTSVASSQEKEVYINASVTTKSEDKNIGNNQAAVNIPIRMKADISFNGYSEPNLLHFSKKTSLLQHNFDIYNNGPSPLLDARIKINVPELTEFVAIDCAKSTLKNCSTEFSLEDLNYGERKLIKIFLIVDAEIFKKAQDIKFLKSTAELTRKQNPLYLDDKPDWSSTAEIITNLQTETKPVSSWVIIVSILAGLIVLALLILILWRVGFFKRNKAGDRDPLTEDGEQVEQHEKDVLTESNGKKSSPLPSINEEKVELNENTDVQNVEV